VLWGALQTRTRATDCRIYGLPAWLLDVGLNSVLLLFSITLYASQSVLLNALILSPALLLCFQSPPSSSPAEKINGAQKTSTAKPVSAHKPFVTAYRGGMMIITCLCILAVDFKIFPRRFAKVETWGTSLVSP
jgi:glucosaminylphosphatidylinositol acyltransferase